jgi:hypothetical protein
MAALRWCALIVEPQTWMLAEQSARDRARKGGGRDTHRGVSRLCVIVYAEGVVLAPGFLGIDAVLE